MNRNAILFLAIFAFALTAISCSTASNKNTGAVSNSNANTAVVVSTSNANVTSNLTAGGGGENTASGNSNIPGIPNIPGADKPISKTDPTRSAKIQDVKRTGPDNSEITTSLGQDLVETRAFKNNAQIAKIEVIGTGKKTVKVYLRNGQVRELPEGKVGDPLSESASNILKALAGGGTNTAQGKPESKPTSPAAATDIQKKQ